MLWASDSGYTGETFRDGQTWFFPGTSWSFLFTAASGISILAAV
jgi:hypothetical protein